MGGYHYLPFPAASVFSVEISQAGSSRKSVTIYESTHFHGLISQKTTIQISERVGCNMHGTGERNEFKMSGWEV
jgi:hypothetical protein